MRVLALLLFCLALPAATQEPPELAPNPGAAELVELRAEIVRLRESALDLRIQLATAEAAGVDWVQLGTFIVVLGGVVVTVLTAWRTTRIERDVNSTSVLLKVENKALVDAREAELVEERAKVAALQAELLASAKRQPAIPEDDA